MHLQTDVYALLSHVADSISARLGTLCGSRFTIQEVTEEGWHHFVILAQEIDADGSVGGLSTCVAKLSATIDRSLLPNKIMYATTAEYLHRLQTWLEPVAKILGVPLVYKE